MATLNLSAYKPVSGTTGDASQISNGFGAVEAVVNALDDANIASGANIAVAKLSPGTNGQMLYTTAGAPAWGAAPAVYTPPAPATTLPGSPTNLQQAILTDSTTAPTYNWLMQYSTAASAWLFVGGAPISSEVDASENISSTTYVDAATVGPTFTVPRAGTYEISFGLNSQAINGGPSIVYAAPKIGAAATADADGVNQSAVLFNQQQQISMARTRRFTCAANDVIKLQYRNNTANASPVYLRWMKAIPVKLT